jgi:hypothetical protein
MKMTTDKPRDLDAMINELTALAIGYVEQNRAPDDDWNGDDAWEVQIANQGRDGYVDEAVRAFFEELSMDDRDMVEAAVISNLDEYFEPRDD